MPRGRTTHPRIVGKIRYWKGRGYSPTQIYEELGKDEELAELAPVDVRTVQRIFKSIPMPRDASETWSFADSPVTDAPMVLAELGAVVSNTRGRVNSFSPSASPWRVMWPG